MLLHDRVCDGQAEASAFADFLGREKRIEDLRLQFVGDARPIVVDLEEHRLLIGVVPGADDQRAAAVRGDHRLLGVDHRFKSTCCT